MDNININDNNNSVESQLEQDATPINTIEVIPDIDNTIPQTIEFENLNIPSETNIENNINITENTRSLALMQENSNIVETFLKLDLSSGWKPPSGYVLIPDDQLPYGWIKKEIQTPVPSTITATQIRLWLVSHNISMEQIDSVIDSIENPLLRAQIKVQWEYAPYVERNHQMINTLGSVLGLDQNTIDMAFIEASQY